VGATFKVSVDLNKCCGYAICAEICPEVFKLDDQGFAVVIEDQVGGDLFASASEAEAACPEAAISLEPLA
jgi:ferredoxin